MLFRKRDAPAGGFFYALGYWIEMLDLRALGERGSPAAAADAAYDVFDSDLETDGASHLLDEVLAFAGTAAGSWALAALLRPKRISWPRAILAGAVATTLSHAAERLESYVAGGEEGDEPGAEPDLVARYISGIATAVAYASVVYPRLPGPPMTRGLVFGLLEASTAPSGGVMAALRGIAPGLSFPLGSLALPGGGTGTGPVANMAYGLGLGLVYRQKRRRKARD